MYKRSMMYALLTFYYLELIDNGSAGPRQVRH